MKKLEIMAGGVGYGRKRDQITPWVEAFVNAAKWIGR